MKPGPILASWAPEESGFPGHKHPVIQPEPNLGKLLRSRGLGEETKPMKHREVTCSEDKENQVRLEVKVSGICEEARDF